MMKDHSVRLWIIRQICLFFLLVLLACPSCGAVAEEAVPPVLPEGITVIEDDAFAGCSSLAGELMIPQSVTEIGDHAFDGCEGLVLLVREGSYAQAWCGRHSVPWRLMADIAAIIPADPVLTVANGASVPAMVTTEPAGGETGLVWTSSDDLICTVSGDGVITGQYPGQAEITVSSPDGLVSAQISVTVQANYRAVLFSEVTYKDEQVIRNQGDVRLMEKMLAAVTGPDGGRYEVSSFTDLTADEVYDRISAYLTAPSRDGDVSMFFFASHGDRYSTSQQYAGRLWCKNKETWLELPTLAQELSKVRGKVIVLLESCGPGAALVTFKGTGEQEPEITDDPGLASAMLSAFAEADPGLAVRQPAISGIIPRGDNLFLTEKFIVMTAAAYRQISYSYNGTGCNLFPYYLTKGVGTVGLMPADRDCGNRDGRLTVQELYQYVLEHTGRYQTPQVYPKNCDEVLFLRAQ